MLIVRLVALAGAVFAGGESLSALGQGPPGAAGGQAAAATPAVVRVLVTDNRTQAPLGGVLVRVQPVARDAQTDTDGRAIIADLAPGTYVLQISLITHAYVERQVVVASGQTLDVAIPLAEGAGTHTESVSVTGVSQFGTRERGVSGQQTLTGADIRNLRGVMFDDPLRAVQALPGVASSNDGSAVFSVRGQPPRRTQMAFDGIQSTTALLHTMDNPEIGSASLINSDILDETTLLSGAYPQRIGGGIGPQLDLRSRSGSTERVRFLGSVSGTAASAIVEGPFGRSGRGSWLVSGRQSYIGWIVGALEGDEPPDEPDEPDSVSFSFSDTLVKASYALTPAHRLEAASLGGLFSINLELLTPQPNETYDGRNLSSVNHLSLQSTLGERLVLQQRGYLVTNRLNQRNLDDVLLMKNRLRTLGYRADLTASLARAWTVDAGGSVENTRHEFDHIADITDPVNGRGASFDGDGYLVSGYGQARWQGLPNLTVTAGGRIDRSSLAEDTVASPWGQVEWQLAPETTMRAGASLAYGLPTFEHLQGRQAGQALKPERIWTYDLSLERRVGASSRVVVTGYLREERDLLWRRDSEPRLVNGVPTVESRSTPWENLWSGTSRGIELLVQRRTSGRLNGWIAYSLSDSENEDVLTGESFAADYDQRHTLNAYVSYRLSHRTTLGVKYLYGSNFPMRGYYTAGPLADDEEHTPTYLLTEQRNTTRLPVYSRLDLRMSRAFTFGRSRLTLFVEGTNVLNRANWTPNDDGEVEQLFPFFPSAGIVWEF